MIHDLRILPCLSSLRDDDLAYIGKLADFKQYSKNDVIFEESTPANSFFIVRSGSVKLYKTSMEGRELVIKTIGRGDHFCFVPMYACGKYSVSAAAVEDSILVAIPAENFRDLMESYVGETGMKVIAGLCSRLKYLSSLLEDFTFRDVEQRVVIALLRLAEEKSPKENIVTLSASHNDIASMTGSVREVVSRAFSMLKKEGIITESGIRRLNIDKRKLSKFLGCSGCI